MSCMEERGYSVTLTSFCHGVDSRWVCLTKKKYSSTYLLFIVGWDCNEMKCWWKCKVLLTVTPYCQSWSPGGEMCNLTHLLLCEMWKYCLSEKNLHHLLAVGHVAVKMNQWKYVIVFLTFCWPCDKMWQNYMKKDSFLLSSVWHAMRHDGKICQTESLQYLQTVHIIG